MFTNSKLIKTAIAFTVPNSTAGGAATNTVTAWAWTVYKEAASLKIYLNFTINTGYTLTAGWHIIALTGVTLPIEQNCVILGPSGAIYDGYVTTGGAVMCRANLPAGSYRIDTNIIIS